MPKFPKLAAAAIGLALAATLPAAAEQATFDFSVAGIRVGSLTMESDQSGDRYTAMSRIDTAGIAGLIDFFYDGTASGTVSDAGNVVPSRFRATSKSPRALRETAIDWQGGTPVTVSVEPPRSSAPDPATQGGTLDPVSAGFRLLRAMPAAEICSTTIDVFDGSRRSRLKLASPTENADGIVCQGTFARIEGEAHNMIRGNEFPFRLVFAKAGSGLATLERIEAPTSFGQAVISRRG
jgi:hypothetical protein